MAEAQTPGTFIPRDAAVVAAPTRRRTGGGLNDLLLLGGIVLFVASVALAVGVYLYGQYLTAESASKVSQLQRAEAAFEPSLIEQITRLDDRMTAANSILQAHIAPSAFFAALQSSTLQTVSFQTLDFEAPDPEHITVKMQGVAQSVNSIALQAQIFSKSGVITSPIFSDIAREPDGVHFDFAASVDPTALSYESLVSSESAQNTSGTQGAVDQSAQPQDGTSPFDSQQQDATGQVYQQTNDASSSLGQ